MSDPQARYRAYLDQDRYAREHGPPPPPAPPADQRAAMLAYAATTLGLPVEGALAVAIERLLTWVPRPAGSLEAQRLFIDDLALVLKILTPGIELSAADYDLLVTELATLREPSAKIRSEARDLMRENPAF